MLWNRNDFLSAVSTFCLPLPHLFSLPSCSDGSTDQGLNDTIKRGPRNTKSRRKPMEVVKSTNQVLEVVRSRHAATPSRSNFIRLI
ncbi:secreted protein [gut metagenome]|uniref:Secreted protein n=1 Tax=gut metagenome TaxID=749906 RepID=J9FK79_9ZZZZ